jgi:hypothetical protein
VAASEERCTCVKFGFKLGKSASEMRDMHKQLSVTMSWGENTFLSGFLDLHVGKLRLKIVSIQFFFPQDAQMKTWRKFPKSSTNTDKTSFRRSLAGYASRM